MRKNNWNSIFMSWGLILLIASAGVMSIKQADAATTQNYSETQTITRFARLELFLTSSYDWNFSYPKIGSLILGPSSWKVTGNLPGGGTFAENWSWGYVDDGTQYWDEDWRNNSTFSDTRPNLSPKPTWSISGYVDEVDATAVIPVTDRNGCINCNMAPANIQYQDTGGGKYNYPNTVWASTIVPTGQFGAKIDMGGKTSYWRSIPSSWRVTGTITTN